MALVAPQIERLNFAVIHASVKRAGPRLVAYGVPLEAVDVVGQLRTGLAARPVSAAGLAAVYRYRDAGQVRRNLDTLASAGIIEQADGGAIAPNIQICASHVLTGPEALRAPNQADIARRTTAELSPSATKRPSPARPTPALADLRRALTHYASQLARDIDAGRPRQLKRSVAPDQELTRQTQALSLT